MGIGKEIDLNLNIKERSQKFIFLKLCARKIHVLVEHFGKLILLMF